MNRRVLIISLLAFVVSSACGVGAIRYLVALEAKHQLEVRLEQGSVAYRSVVHGLSQVAQTLFDETVNRPQVTRLVRDVVMERGDRRDIARGLLLRELYPSYQRLKDRGIRQLHFHTPDGLSLLRFHRPLKYGDSLNEVRESIRLTNTLLKPVEGFEAGKLFHGFRFVFPLFHEGQHVGSVEISVSFKTVEAHLRDLVPNEAFQLVLNRDRVFSMLFPSERSIYKPFTLSEEFVIEDFGSKLGQPKVISALQRQLEQELQSERNLIRQSMIAGEAFGLTRKLNGKHYAALFMPVESVAGETDAYILMFTEVHEIASLYMNGLWIQLFFVAFMASIAAGYYRHKAASSVISSEREKLKAITERMAEGLFVQDTAGRITYLNKAAEQILGVKREDAIGKVAHTLFHEHFDGNGMPVTLEECPINSETRQGRIYESENEYFRRVSDQRLVPVQVTSARFSVVGKEQGSITTFRDITQRKEYEAKLTNAREEAIKSAQAKSDFLANMSHEIRTPMNGILGMLELVIDTDLSREQKDFLKIAQSSGRTLLSLLNSILDLSKYEAGRVELESIDFKLRSTLEEIVKLFAPQAQGKGLEIAAVIDHSVNEYACGDPTRLRQVITNLLGNAIKFTEAGEVTLSAQVEAGDGNELVLHVAIQDTGIGIPVDVQEQIFESFSQADGSTTRKYGGTGLGLTLSREIVNHMGGTLWLESKPGQGSTFHFTVKLQRPAHPESCFIPNEQLAGLNVLIVDDNATNRLILERYCDSWQMCHESAEDGLQALALMESRYQAGGTPFDLILTDMMMPEMDGVEFALRLRADPRFAATKLILVSSYTGRALSQQAEEAGFECLLAKPLGRDELHDAIEQVLFSTRRPAAEETLVQPQSVSLDDLRVLLVEDNEVNRLVALANLERLGCEVVSAENGQEALEKISNERFDVVLMDCQMPVMDGFEATRRLRDLEQQSEEQHLPVIAMTAFVTPNEIQRCLDSGMDAHLGKPFELDQLKAILLAYAPQSRSFVDQEPGQEGELQDNNAPTLDIGALSQLNELLDGEVAAILEPFLQQLPDLMSQIVTGVETDDPEITYRAAHTLKSSAANIGGLRLADQAAMLERLAHNGTKSQLENLSNALGREADALTQALRTYLNMD